MRDFGTVLIAQIIKPNRVLLWIDQRLQLMLDKLKLRRFRFFQTSTD